MHSVRVWGSEFGSRQLDLAKQFCSLSIQELSLRDDGLDSQETYSSRRFVCVCMILLFINFSLIPRSAVSTVPTVVNSA